MNLEFIKDTHEYRAEGIKLRSVTQVLSKVLQTDNPWWKREHRLRGTFVHRITDVIDEGAWDPRLTTFPASLGWDDKQKEKVIQRGFAYQRFVDETGFRVLKNELMVHSLGLRLAGTLDKLGIFTKGRYAGCLVIGDIKSGEPTPAAILQVMLYQILLEETDPEIIKGQETIRMVLHLRDDGQARPEYRTNNNGHMDRADALAVLRTYDFMERNKLVTA